MKLSEIPKEALPHKTRSKNLPPMLTAVNDGTHLSATSLSREPYSVTRGKAKGETAERFLLVTDKGPFRINESQFRLFESALTYARENAKDDKDGHVDFTVTYVTSEGGREVLTLV